MIEMSWTGFAVMALLLLTSLGLFHMAQHDAALMVLGAAIGLVAPAPIRKRRNNNA